MPAASHQAALDFLLSRINYEQSSSTPYRDREFKLDRVRRLLAELGDPQRRLPAVHVAGTKGKGSTAAMLASVLDAAGLRTGLYTSPHLHRLEERMAIGGVACGADRLVRLVEEVRPVVEALDREAAEKHQPGCTWFEITTAMAMLYFDQEKVDAAVLEVGLGGRLDATNVCHPAAVIITSISFDHTKQLGNTLAAIAREKAGVIKPGVPVITGVTDPEPLSVIEQIAREQGSPIFRLGGEFQFERAISKPAREHGAAKNRLSYCEGDTLSLADLQLGLLGGHQAANAAVAIAALLRLREAGWAISDKAIRRGLAAARCPARVEQIGEDPAILIDAAHNVASMQALLATLDESFTPRRRWLVFATTREKDIEGMLRLLMPRFAHLVFTRYLNNPRYAPPERLAEIAARLAPELGVDATGWSIAADPASAWKAVREQLHRADLLCVTGSFFIAAEMRDLILGDSP